MKITKIVGIGNEEILIQLMNKVGFYEIDRVSSGGMQSEAILIMTFEGKKEDYNENWYIEIPSKTPVGYGKYYSLADLNGYWTNNLESFKESLSKPKFEIKSLI